MGGHKCRCRELDLILLIEARGPVQRQAVSRAISSKHEAREETIIQARVRVHKHQVKKHGQENKKQGQTENLTVNVGGNNDEKV